MFDLGFSDKEYLDWLANELDDAVKCSFASHLDHKQNPYFFSRSIKQFRTSLMCDHKYFNPRNITFRDVLNHPSYNRYFGNFAGFIMTLVFDPSIYYPYLLDGQKQYTTHLSSESLHDILHTTFKLIIEDGMSVNVVDYYEMQPMTQIMFCLGEFSDRMPLPIKQFVKPFMMLMKKGDKLINVHQSYIRAWIRRKREKQAVKLIEEWWFERVNSPYTTSGQRMMEQRAMNWYMLASS